MTLEQVGYIAVGVCVVLLLTVMWAVARPWVRRWRVRHAIEYRAVAVALEQRWPGFPGCICFPGEHGKHHNPRCAVKRHRR